MSMKQRFKPQLINSVGEPMATEPTGDGVPLAQPQMVVKTLSEQGPLLPVGVMANGTRLRPFRLRPYKMKQEKALARLRDDMKGATIGRFVCEVLSMMVQTVGPHNFDTMKADERQLAIYQMVMPDVLYMYLYLRYEALGADESVVMNIRCPKCANEYRWYGDLNTLEVKVVNDGTNDLVRTFKLRDPIDVRGKTCKTLKLGLIKWDQFSRPEFHSSGLSDSATIQASVVGMDCFADLAAGTFQMASTDLDDMGRYDMSALVADIEMHTPGPQLTVEPECPACKFSSKMMLNWSWDSFFALSARPTPGT